MLVTYKIGILKNFLKVRVHIVMVHCHEQSVDDNAERDEQFHKWIEHNQRDQLLYANPTPATVPHAQNIQTFETVGGDAFLHWPIIITRHC